MARRSTENMETINEAPVLINANTVHGRVGPNSTLTGFAYSEVKQFY